MSVQSNIKTGTKAIEFGPGDTVRVGVDGNLIVARSDGTESNVVVPGVTPAGRILQVKGADVASGGTITLGLDGNRFNVTGTTAINFITTTGWVAGSVVYLRFTGTVTVNHNTGSVPANTAALDLNGSVALSAVAGTRITLCYNGTAWEEQSRTVA